MVVVPLMTVICTTGIAFYVRFFVALCREQKSRLGGFYQRLRLDSRKSAILDPETEVATIRFELSELRQDRI